jgi:hypothetical protein
MVSKLKVCFFPLKEKVSSLGPKGETFSCVKNRSYFIKEELSFSPFQKCQAVTGPFCKVEEEPATLSLVPDKSLTAGTYTV